MYIKKNSNMLIDTYFENHKSVIESELGEAKKNVFVAVAWINFKDYFDVFKDVLSNSVTLKIVCSDNWQNRSHKNEIDELVSLGAEIKLLQMPRQTNHMHHKFSIIDEKTVLNGSFNWSPNAPKSFENILVIKDCPSVVTVFMSEFEKLFLIESESIENLQKIKKCSQKKCDGELFNILVLSEKSTINLMVYGDIVEVCDCCDYFSTIKNCIPENRIEFMVNAYMESFDEIETELIDRDINRLLNSYVTGDILVHAIGRVTSGINHRDEPFTETNIIWKNKFVGNSLQNTFKDTNFGVCYDNS